MNAGVLRLRLATGLLDGDTQQQREAALTAPNPLTLPWIAAALARLEEILTHLASPASAAAIPWAGAKSAYSGQIRHTVRSCLPSTSP